MTNARGSAYARGVLASGVGMLVLSPDGLLMRFIEDASVWDVAFYRTLFLGLAISTFLVARKGTRAVTAVRGIGRFGVLAAVFVAGANIAFAIALLTTTVANALLVLATMPFWSALFGWIFIRERVRPRTWGAIAVSFAGIAIILAGSIRLGSPLGVGIAALGAAFHGASLVTLRRAGDVDSTPVLAVSGLLAALIVLPFAAPLSIAPRDLGVLALIGFIVLPVGLGLFISGTRTVPAAEVALLALVETVLGPFWAWLGVGETPSPAAFVGGALVIGAILMNAFLGLRESARERSATATGGDVAEVRRERDS